MVLWLLLASVSGPLPVEEMSVRLHDRAARLDRLVVDLVYTQYHFPLDASPLDSSLWEPTQEVEFHDRLYIVRPDVLHDELTDEGAYAASRTSIVAGRLVRRYQQPTREGMTRWVVNTRSLDLLRYQWCPILFVFDLHLPDSTIPQLNLVRLFDEFEVLPRDSRDGTNSYEVLVPMNGFEHRYELDLADDGTPQRVLVEATLRGEIIGAWELQVLETRAVNGASFPIEAIVSVSHRKSEMLWNGLHHFWVRDVQQDETLRTADLALEPEHRNAIISDGEEGGVIVYDRDGRVLYRRDFEPGAAGPDDGVAWSEFQRRQQRVGLMAGGTALVVGGLLSWVALARRRES